MDAYKITLENNTMTVEPGMNLIDVCQIMCGALISSVHSLELPAEHMEEVRKELFDSFNLIFSRTLEEAFPEFELRPELTEEAILAMENQIIAERVAAETDLEATQVLRLLEMRMNYLSVVEVEDPATQQKITDERADLAIKHANIVNALAHDEDWTVHIPVALKEALQEMATPPDTKITQFTQPTHKE